MNATTATALTPNTTAARIADLLAEADAIAGDIRRNPPSQHGRLEREISALHCEIGTLRRQCARDFGTSRGYQISGVHFNPGVLAQRGAPDVSCLYEWPSGVADHLFLYRTDDYRAAGAACHLYGLDEAGRADCEHWAAERGLVADFPQNPPSWWWMGLTILVVYTPAGEVAA